MAVKEAVARWKITERQVKICYKKNRIQGVIQLNRILLIPSNKVRSAKQLFNFQKGSF